MPRRSKLSPDVQVRLQGTDGLRRDVLPQVEFPGRTPQQVFLNHGVITEEFLERYAFAHVSLLMQRGLAEPGAAFVVGWDPRDPEGLFTEAVVRGVLKTGANAWVAGRIPTPGVAMYMLAHKAAGGFMVTASHNPREQNGVKIFLAYRGLKMLPENDIALSRAVLEQGSLAKVPLAGRRCDVRKKALQLFQKFHLDPKNSWIDGLSLEKVAVVVDPARGCLSRLGAEVFRKAGFGEVHEVNRQLDGHVNLYSGVAALEGHAVITADMVGPRGRFIQYPALQKVFALGRRYRSRAAAGQIRVCGAVFDADGDRFFRLDYDPERDCLQVMSGDETAFFQARYLAENGNERFRQAWCLNTVESDLNTQGAVKDLALRHDLSAVGDKWILWRIAQMAVQKRLDLLGRKTRGARQEDRRQKWEGLHEEWKRIKAGPAFDVFRLQALEEGIDALAASFPSPPPASGAEPDLAVGSEETGHTITTGWLDGADGKSLSVHCGNGLKSALNTFAATETLFRDAAPAEYFKALERPFPPGYKHTTYAYYIDQGRFYQGSPVWNRIKRALTRMAGERGFTCKAVQFPGDPDMLYLSLGGSAKDRRAAVFVRNSGTENKISVNLRGNLADAQALEALEETAAQVLMTEMKDPGHQDFPIEQDILARLFAGPLAEHAIPMGPERRVFLDLGKQGLIQPGPAGYRLTPRGAWYREFAAKQWAGLQP